MHKKIKIFLKAVLIASVLFMTSATVAEAANKVGYVDLRRAFYEYDEAISLREEMSALTEEIQQKINEIAQEKAELREKAQMLSGDARQDAQTQYELKLAELQEYEREKRQELMAKEDSMFRRIVQDIEEIVTAIAEEDDFDYILDSRYIMFATDEMDLTDEVLQRLNQ